MIHLTKRMLKLKVVRYFFTAAFATVVDVSVFFIAIHYIFHEAVLQLFGNIPVSAHAISLGMSYSCGLVTNFYISKHYVFKESDLRTRHQFMRFAGVALFVLFLNYLFMSFLIKRLEWYPTIARTVSAVTIGVISFIVHKTFSFRVTNKEEVVE